MKIKTRAATRDDRDQLYALYVSVLKVHITKIWGWDESWQQRDFDNHFNSGRIRVAVVGDQVVGYIHVDRQAGMPHVRMLCIAQEYQRKGIGSALLMSFIRESAVGKRDVVLEVFRVNTDARRFYERLGFSVCGKTETHYEMKRSA